MRYLPLTQPDRNAMLAVIGAALIAVTPAMANAPVANSQELSIETIRTQHAKLNGKIVRFRGVFVSGGMGNQGLCSDDTRQRKCLWFGGSGLINDIKHREPGAKRFIVQGRLNDRCIREECTDSFAQIENAIVIGQY